MTASRPAAASAGADDRRRRLRDIVARKSLSIGPEVTLASGAKSRFYFNMKPTMFDPEGAALIADLILDAIADDPPYDYVGGMEIGAVPVAACVAMRSGQRGRPIPAFFVRKQAKDHGAKKLIEGDIGAGMKVLVLEDVTTTGGSALKAIAALRDAGATVTRVITLVDRLEGAAKTMKAQGLDLVALLTADDFNLEGNR
ncbi:MAG: orotate phosphoribosyltransferase [Alphaproteobacteria bacterium]|nr:orotate phosphoribosyltransferase [Alphaproteobacteria bacterium]